MDHVLTTQAQGQPRARMLLMHDSNEPMDSPWLEQLAKAIAELGVDVVRWELSYMHLRRTQPKRQWREPSLHPRMGELDDCMDELRTIATDLPLILGGKGSGARLVTSYSFKYSAKYLAGVVSFGYPIPAEKHHLKYQLDLIKHLYQLPCPHLVLQGNAARTTNSERLMPWLRSDATEWVWTNGFAHSMSNLERYLGALLCPHPHLSRLA